MTTLTQNPFSQHLLQRHHRVDVRGAANVGDLLDAAGPDFAFRVETRPVKFDRADGVLGTARGQVVVRADTEEALAVVGPDYVPAQVADFLAPLDSLLRTKALVPVSATTFDRGLAVAVELQFPEPLVLRAPNGEEDVILRRVVWRNAHDGSSRLAFIDSILRRWCKNGAAHIIGMAGDYFKHIASGMAEAAQLSLDGAVSASSSRFTVVAANLKLLAATPFSRSQMAGVAERLYPAFEDGEVSSRAQSARTSIVELFENGKGNFGRTAYDALNAVTDWTSHHRPVRGSQGDLARLKSIWMGDDQARGGLAAVASLASLRLVPETGALATA